MQQRPLASIGILSAATYQHRRDAVRETWLQWAEVRLGRLLVIFVVMSPTLPSASLQEEVSSRADLLLVPTPTSLESLASSSNKSTATLTKGLLRLTAPLVSTFAWLQYATSRAPFNQSDFVIKMDDDVYLVVPALTLQLQMMSRRLGRESHVYFGRFFWTAWNFHDHHHVHSWGNPRVGVDAPASM